MRTDMPTYIIAEAGVNHNGDMNLAKQLIDVAADAGADAVKFQTFRASAMISRYAPKAEYQTRTTGADESQLDMASDHEWESNVAMAEARGYVLGVSGKEPDFKPNALAASFAADAHAHGLL